MTTSDQQHDEQAPSQSNPVLQRNQRLRVVFRGVGLLLWCLVFVVLYFMWRETKDPQIPATSAANVPTSGTPHVLSELVVEEGTPLWSPQGIGEFALTERNGQTVTKADLLGRPWVVAFIFTRCAGPCPRVTGQMKLLQDYIQKSGLDVRLVTISVDPKFDTPEVLTRYADSFKADPQMWYFLTGDRDEIYRLIRKDFRMPVGEQTTAGAASGYEVLHTTNILQLDEQGRVRGKYDSLDDVEMAKLRRVLSGKAPAPINYDEDPEQQQGQAPEASNADQTPDEQQSKEEVSKPVLPQKSSAAPAWVLALPAVNASLNALATALLLAGYRAIRWGKTVMHRRLMLSTFAVSVAFLVCYVVYHFALNHYTGESSKRFPGVGPAKVFYLSMLASHVVLALFVPFLAVATIYRGLKGQWQKHRKIASVTYPIWLFVSVTGVMIYVMLYNWPSGS